MAPKMLMDCYNSVLQIRKVRDWVLEPSLYSMQGFGAMPPSCGFILHLIGSNSSSIGFICPIEWEICDLG